MSEVPIAAPWSLRLGAQPQLVSAAGQVLALEGVDGLLLAWLALEGPTPRARLLDLLWPGEEPGATLRNRLRQRLFALKRRLGTEAVAGAQTLALAVHWAGHDAAADGGLMLSALASEPPAALASWLITQRERQRAARSEHRAAEAARLEREGRLAEAIDHAEQRLRLEPLMEHAHRQLMRLHYLRGDRAAAIQAFERCERVLKDELGVRPGSETLALLAQVEAARVPMAPVARPVTAALLRPPRLVGRAAEWQQLTQAWARRLPVVLSGEGGLGKSRLLADLAAAQPQPVLHVAARPGDADVPLTLLSRVLRALGPVQRRSLPPGCMAELTRLLPELGGEASIVSATAQAGTAIAAAVTAVADATAGVRLENAVRSAVGAAAAEGLFALVLDDLHLADPASLELLRALLAEPVPVWAAALRPGPQPPALQAFLGALLGAGEALSLALQPLDLAAIAEFCDSLDLPGLSGRQWAPALHQRTGGNPQYMLEILKAWWLMPAQDTGPANSGLPVPAPAGMPRPQDLPTPVSLPRLVAQRIESLSSVAVDLARCAAIAGEDFSPELAAEVLRVRPVDLANPWAELEAARVFDGERFAHDLIAEAARASVPGPVARVLHADVVRALQNGASPRPVEPARLAHHALCAGRWTVAAEAFEQAAQRCAVQGRRSDEADAWQQAAQAWHRAGQAAPRFSALRQRAGVLLRHAGGARVNEALNELDTLAGDAPQQRSVAALRLARAQEMGDFETTLRLGPAALEAAWAGGGPAEALPLVLSLSGALAKMYRGAEGVALLERLRDWIDGPEPSNTDRINYWNAMAMVLDFSSRFAEALQAWRTTQHHARRDGLDRLSQSISNEAFTLNKMGRMHEAVARGREALRLDLAQGDGLQLLTHHRRLALGHHLRNAGHLAEALSLLQQASAAFQNLGHHADATVAVHLLAVLWLQLGQPGRAHRLLDEDRAHPVPERLQFMREAHRVLVDHALGDRRATARATQIAHHIEKADAENLVPRAAVLLVAPALPPDQAEPLAVGLAAWFAARQRMGHALAAHVLAGRAALAQGAVARAWPHVQAADGLAREHQPDIVYSAERFWLAAQVHEAMGQTALQRQTLDAAQAWIQACAQALEPPLRRAFLERQPVNADLLRWAGLQS